MIAKFVESPTEEKNSVIRQAERTQGRLALANRLVNGLSSEKVRWRASVGNLQTEESTLVGDMLLAAAFISYVGPFNRAFRSQLVDAFTKRIKELQIPMNENASPLKMLTDDATIAQWNNDKLPTDPVSLENAAIFCACERWPLIVDPQLQGVAWIKAREENAGANLRVVRLNQHKWIDVIERAVQAGDPVIIENIDESIDAVLNPLLGRNVTKKGRSLFIKLGDKEVEYDPNFKLFLQTKMANPHYSPEIQAQTTMINFTVTEDGLEDQLLALVVDEEKPELEAQKTALMRQQNEFKIKLKELEEALLARLSAATGDILSDTALIENLEDTKKTSTEIGEKVKEAKITEANINAAREQYRPAAARSAMLYFLLNSLDTIDKFYQFSLAAFITVFYKSL
ncbi:dynein heavy chain [Kipferlia bialata]|uniref:Dynein heavy chain n=1 Tax=Kipferlia bialata TaxID=797122 RepID=A0A9K3CUX8_9EUKA|nr:dynein heavy chain [Kipferlia bialata]|eukprot:g5149.t1